MVPMLGDEVELDLATWPTKAKVEWDGLSPRLKWSLEDGGVVTDRYEIVADDRLLVTRVFNTGRGGDVEARNEDEALTMLSIFHQVARKAATKWNGTVVKTMGDGVLMQFKETQSAVEAVQALSSAFTAALLPLDLPVGRLRTGLHYGLVATGRDGDLFGGAVNLASRLERVAEPGQLVLSHTAAEHLGDEIELEDLGERALKNVDQPMQCWAIRV